MDTTLDTTTIFSHRVDFFDDCRSRGQKIATEPEANQASLLDTVDREHYFALRGVGYSHVQAFTLIAAHYESEISLWENFETLARLARES